MEPRAKRHKSNVFKRISRWFTKLSKAKKIAVITVAVLLISASGASAWYYNRLSDMEGLFPEVNWPGGEDGPDTGLTIDEAFQDSKIINIALIGYDMNEERSNERVKGHPGLADTIMVAAIDIETGDIDLVSIPRDTLTPIYNTGGWKDKINSASYWGWVNAKEDRVAAGMKSQLETISIALGGVPIHYYVTVNMESVIEVVDIMGGVWFDVERNVYDKNGKLVVSKGYQKLDGNHFMRFVRNRNIAEGDFGRAKNQQAVLMEAFSQFKKANKLVYAPQVFTSIKDDITTNLSLEQIMALALFGTQSVNPDTITTHVMQGTYKSGGIPGRRESNVYFLIDQQKRSQLIRDIWGIVIHPGPDDVLLPPLEDPADPSSNPSDFPDPDDNPGDIDFPGQPGDDDDSGGEPNPGSGNEDEPDPGENDGEDTGLDTGSDDPSQGIDY